MRSHGPLKHRFGGRGGGVGGGLPRRDAGAGRAGRDRASRPGTMLNAGSCSMIVAVIVLGVLAQLAYQKGWNGAVIGLLIGAAVLAVVLNRRSSRSVRKPRPPAAPRP